MFQCSPHRCADKIADASAITRLWSMTTWSALWTRLSSEKNTNGWEAACRMFLFRFLKNCALLLFEDLWMENSFKKYRIQQPRRISFHWNQWESITSLPFLQTFFSKSCKTSELLYVCFIFLQSVLEYLFQKHVKRLILPWNTGWALYSIIPLYSFCLFVLHNTVFTLCQHQRLTTVLAGWLLSIDGHGVGPDSQQLA